MKLIVLSTRRGARARGRMAVRPPPDDRAIVASLDTAYQAAVKANDAQTMDRILTDDFILVIGNGTVYTKADLLKQARDKSVDLRAPGSHAADRADVLRQYRRRDGAALDQGDEQGAGVRLQGVVQRHLREARRAAGATPSARRARTCPERRYTARASAVLTFLSPRSSSSALAQPKPTRM